MKTKFKVPHTLVLLLSLVLVSYLLSLILPQGAFERVGSEEERQTVVQGTYRTLETPVRLSPTVILTAIPRGFDSGRHIIFFIFIVGGFFGVLRESGAIDGALSHLLRRLGKRPYLLVIGSMLLFSLGSYTFGMAESYLPFVPVMIILSIGLGFDALAGVAIMCTAYAVGFSVSAFNPFTLLIAQDIAGLRPLSGMGLRIGLYFIFMAVAIHHVLRYIQRIKQDPSKSLVHDIEPDPLWTREMRFVLTLSHNLILITALAAVVFMVYGIGAWHWGLTEMGALFLGLTLVTSVLGRLHPDKASRAFCEGASGLTTTALLIGVARAIQIVLNDGMVIDTIVHAVSLPLASLGSSFAAVGMYLFQSMTNFLITSGSGQACVTMPIMAPLSDLVNVPRQVAVLAFQFGDGFTNILVPTNSILIGILAMARVPYERWFRFIIPFMLKLFVVGSIVLILATWLGYH
jgi:uncharacterized ion transporter superfamily protein YfcC